MKIKTDFVTNSSSVSFIFESDCQIRRNDIDWKFHKWERLSSFKTKKQLIAYIQVGKCDWINLARGPTEFYNMSEEEYNECLKIINKNKIAVYGCIEQHRRIHDFEVAIGDRGAKLIYKEWH